MQTVSQLRTSSFVIYVELPEDSSSVLLVHGYTGAFDKVSRKVAAQLRRLDHKPPKPLHGTWSDDFTEESDEPLSDATIELLTRRGYLVTRDVEDERAFAARIGRLIVRDVITTGASYVIMPTYDCNLRCAYCFQDDMRKNPAKRGLLRTMSEDMAIQVIKGIANLEKRAGFVGEKQPLRNVTFFGGEPLLERSRPIVEFFMEHARQLGDVRFMAVSNATQLKSFEGLLGPGSIETIQVTIDGPPALHDKRRIHADGSGSFEQIADNIDFALDQGVVIDVRMNIDRSNIEHLPAAIAEFDRRGWTKRAGFTCYVAPVHAANDNLSKRETFNSAELNDELKKMQSVNATLNCVGTADTMLKDNLLAVFKGERHSLTMSRSSYCGAHTNMYVIDSFGDIYACWERTGDKNLRIGWIESDGSVQMVEDRLVQWRGRTASSNDTCAQCRYTLLCGGGCAVLAEEVHGTIYGNYCDAFGKRFRRTAADAYLTFTTQQSSLPVAVSALRAL